MRVANVMAVEPVETGREIELKYSCQFNSIGLFNLTRPQNKEEEGSKKNSKAQQQQYPSRVKMN